MNTRIIKFRAWHPGHPIDGKNKKGTMLSWGEFDIESWILKGSQEGVMQYTGLADKNGKEIYEGDIVKEFFGAYWLIEWNEDYLHWAFKTVKEAPKDGNFLDTSDMKSPKRLLNRSEVIGNIYENPELIKK